MVWAGVMCSVCSEFKMGCRVCLMDGAACTLRYVLTSLTRELAGADRRSTIQSRAAVSKDGRS